MEITEKINSKIRECKEKQLIELDLSNCGLIEILFSISELTHIKKLNLSGNRLLNFKGLEKLDQLDELNLGNCGLIDLPEELFKLPNLKKLILDENRINQFKGLEKLCLVDDISLWNCGLEQLPKELFQLSNLRCLKLSYNNIKEIPPEISNLKNLTEFDISHNSIHEIHNNVMALKNLSKLDISFNIFENFPLVITELSNLKILNLGGNRIKLFPEAISVLKNLNSIDLSYSGLDEIPQFIFHFNQLTELNLKNNEIKIITEKISSLQSLEVLIISNNKIASLPTAMNELDTLKSIDLSNNSVEKISLALISLPQLKGLMLRNNPLKNLPIEIAFEKNLEDNTNLFKIKNYFKELEEAEEKDILFEIKLLIVGEERAGKSSIAEAIINPDYKFKNKQSTYGIDIKKWVIPQNEFINSPKNFKVNIWDFGGQEIYHATHQFFLTKQSIYFLVTESRNEMKHEEFFYWLNIIENLSNKSPIILVQNKCDLPSIEIPVREYQENFPNIINFLKISCKNNYKDTITNLKNAILDVLNDKTLTPDVGALLPKSWINIRNELEVLKDQRKNYISREEYLLICEKYNLPEKRALWLSDYFHRLGVFLHFQDFIYLEDTIFLNHEWVTAGVYNVLDNQKIIDNHGKFNDEDLKKIWAKAKYKEKRHELLLLMIKFDLCYEIGKGKYLAPQLLSADVPVDLGEFTNLEELNEPLFYEYRYKFIPKGILSRLIVKLNKYIFKESSWRHGVVLEYENTRALIRELYFDRKIQIIIEGFNRKELLGIIRANIMEINKSFNNLKVNEMIRCDCPNCTKSEKPHYYEFDNLFFHLKKGKKTVECSNSLDDININKLLGNVFIEEKDKGKNNIVNIGTLILGERDMIKVKISGGNVNFADHIGKIIYNQNYGINENEFEDLQGSIQNLADNKKQELNSFIEEFKKTNSKEGKNKIFEKIKDLLLKNGIEAAKSISVEIVKSILKLNN